MTGTTERRLCVTSYRILIFLATVCGLTQILFLVDANFSRPKQFQESDYIMTFYVAGRLVAAGRESDLYPAPDATSFVDASFNKAAHRLLDSLPEKTTAIYMYSPLVATFFAPLSQLSPNWSLLMWHVISIMGLILSCKILAELTKVNFSESLFLCSLFAPVFITLWSGQLGLVFGLLPLCLGYLFLMQDRALIAGHVWSLLLLKPQYFPAVAFVALVLVLNGKFRLALGLALGISAVAAANLLLFSPGLVTNWLASHKLSDTLFTDVRYGIPVHLVTSLPADVLFLLPTSSRSAWKWPAYFGALLIWLMGLWYCWKISRGPWESRKKLSLTLAVGCVLSGLALPHLLYYDLCILIPAGFMLATRNNLVDKIVGTKIPARLAWASISLYMPIFLLFKTPVGMALILEMILFILFILILVRINYAIMVPNAA